MTINTYVARVLYIPFERFHRILQSWRTRLVITLTLFSVVTYGYWPGGLYSDSFVQFSEAASGHYTDWHPPVMGWLWLKLLALDMIPDINGHSAGIFLIFQLAMLFAGSFIMSSCKNERGQYPFLWVFFPLLPQILGHAGLLVKDVEMAFSLFLMVASLRLLRTIDNIFLKRLLLFLIILSSCYALLLRHNAIFAFFPIIYYLCKIHFSKIRSKYIFIITIILSIISILFTHIFNYRYLNAKKSHSERVMYVDIISISSHFAEKNLFTFSPYNKYTYNDLPKNYEDGGLDFYRNNNFELLKCNFFYVIKNHPLSYLKGQIYKILNFMVMPLPQDQRLSYTKNKRCPFFYSGLKTYSSEGVFPDNLFFQLIKWYVLTMFEKFPFIFSRFFFLFLGCFLGIIFLKNNSLYGLYIKMLSISGVLYTISNFIFVPTPDYRFTYWTYIAILTSLFLAFLELFRLSYQYYLYKIHSCLTSSEEF